MPLPPTYTSTTFTYTYSASSPLPPSGPYFDFTLAFSPSSLTVTQGGTANYQILITYSNPSYGGTSITVVNVAGLGPGMNYQIIPSPAGLRISTSQSTPTGTYNIVLTGSAMGVMRQASAVLQVQAAEQPFDFSILVSPLDRIVTPGGSVTYTVAVNLVAGTAQSRCLERARCAGWSYRYVQSNLWKSTFHFHADRFGVSVGFSGEVSVDCDWDWWR